jgi:hypothetical protein
MPIDATQFRRGLNDLAAGIVNAAAHALDSAMAAAEDDARGTALFKDRTGETRGSIHKRRGGGLSGVVSAHGAAVFLENGTRAHPITAKNGKMLRFMVNGSPRFARSVRHPGTRPRPFMGHAHDAGEQALAYAIDFYVSEAIHRVR